MSLTQARGKVMEYVGQVDEKMIDLIRDANTIRLDIDSGDKEFTLNASFDTMLEIGAGIVSYTRATFVKIYATDDNNKIRMIEFHPSTGNYDLEIDEWVDNTPSKVTLEIQEPSYDGLWTSIRECNLKVIAEGYEWEFIGKRCDLVAFIVECYEPNDPEEHIKDIVKL